MATYGTQVRRGLPRAPGADPWPPAAAVPEGAASVAPDAAAAAGTAPVAPPAAGTVPPSQSGPAEASDGRFATGEQSAGDVVASADAPAGAPAAPPARGAIRRGLPRVPGGEPWPPAAATTAAVSAPALVSLEASTPTTTDASASVSETAAAATTAVAAAPATPVAAAPAAGAAAGVAVRRGLPRAAGGDPWPPADFTPAAPATPSGTVPLSQSGPDGAGEGRFATGEQSTATPAAATATAAPTEAAAAAATTPAPAAVAVAERTRDLSTPLPFTRTVWPGPAAREFEAERLAGAKPAASEPSRIGPFTKGQWAGIVVVGGAGLLYAAGMLVVAVRWLLSTQWGAEFLAAFPGEYHLPEGAPVGFPAWLGWQHFFNVFLMVLIIRSGLRVRSEKRPTAFWTPRGNPKGKISLTLWFHQALDVLWIVNGLVFVVLLFVSGQWMRIVPTSWEVFPNAISAALQYVSLDWPTENGWVNYNSLQQLAYFTTVFIAAPLAILTGVRMSGVWPKNAKALNGAYPVEWARAVHFPVMLYFVAFIAVHVLLVFATGALRNLNHMYAAQGSVDPNAYADNWLGFWLFVVSLVVIAAAWIAARPLVLAPIARLFGTVSGR